VTTSGSVSLAELSLLFTGVPDEEGWSTSPAYSVTLAFEIAKRCDTRTEKALQMILYDNSKPEQIPVGAQIAIRRGVKLYLEHLASQGLVREL
jgi:hypothetical protein